MDLLENTQPLMVFENVVKKRTGGRGYALTVADFRIYPQDRLALIGDSGSGKSTLLDMMALILRPDEADNFSWQSALTQEVDLFKTWQDKKVSKFENIRRNDLGYVMQTGGLLPFLSVEDNILLPAELKKTDLK
jgi:putative ABC transport system ATP-binding protein